MQDAAVFVFPSPQFPAAATPLTGSPTIHCDEEDKHFCFALGESSAGDEPLSAAADVPV